MRPYLSTPLIPAVFLSLFLTALPIFSAAAQDAAQDAVQAGAAGSPQHKSKEISRELSTLTVTAQKREENIQEVPVSITALSDIQIEDAGITSMKDLSFYTPNLFIVKSGNHAEQAPIMRGMFNRMNPNPTVGMFVDGVSYSRHLAYDPDLFDIERIEVLRGPQGTLFGRNTEAGAINIVTRKPGNEARARLSAAIADHATRDFAASLETPLIQDRLYLGMSGKRFISDGYMENDVTGNDAPEFRDDMGGRARLRWTPSDRLDMMFSAEASDYADGFGCFSPFDQLSSHINNDYEGRVDNHTNGQSISLDYLGDQVRITAITARRHTDFDITYDMDMTGHDLMVNYYYQDHEQWSQEIRLASPDDGRRFKWLVGAYYMDENFDLASIFDYPQGFPQYGIPAHSQHLTSDLHTVNSAAFGQATYTLWDRLGLTAGLRYDYDEKDFTGTRQNSPDMGGQGRGVVRDKKSHSVWLPKLAADYRFTRDIMGYAGVSKGYTAGAFNDLDGSAGVHGVPYEAEYSWNWEAGLKTAFLDNRVIVNTSVFYIDWKDKQVFLNKGAVGNVFQNAAEATSKGFEVETQIRPAPGLEIVGGLGYIRATYDRFTAPVFDPSGNQMGEKSYEGNRLEMAPRFSYNLAVQYRHPLTRTGTLFTRVEWQGVGEFYYDLDNSHKQERYHIVNAKVGYEAMLGRHDLAVYLWTKNLFDQSYCASAWGSSERGYYGRLGEPRMIGINVTYRF